MGAVGRCYQRFEDMSLVLVLSRLGCNFAMTAGDFFAQNVAELCWARCCDFAI